MISDFMDMLFGCWHSNYSFPITSKDGRKRATVPGCKGTYVVCLDCGKEFAYDWKTMKVMSPQKPADEVLTEAPVMATKQAA